MAGAPFDLDDQDELLARDRDGLLFHTAYAGAVVRQATATIEREGVRDLDASATRNLVIVAGSKAAGGAASLRAVSELLDGPPVTICDAISSRHPWLGAADLVLVLTADGMEQGLTDSLAVAVAAARGSEVLVVAPENSAVHQLAINLRAAWMSPAGDEPGGAFWSALTLVAHLGGARREVLEQLADELDRTAQDCGPVSPRSRNIAKVLGEYAASGRALAVGEDDVSLAAARLLASHSLDWAGVPVADVRRDEPGLERAIQRSRREGSHDIFHDPLLDGPAPEPDGGLRILLMAHGPTSGEQRQLAETAAREAVDVAVALPGSDDPLTRAGELYLQAQLAAAYCAIIAD